MFSSGKNARITMIFSLCLLSAIAVKADILGSYANTVLHPGHLDFNPHSVVYQPNIRIEKHEDNVERRTPSQILHSFMNTGGSFNISKSAEFIDEVHYLQQNAFLAYCSQALPKTFNRSALYCQSIEWRNPHFTPPDQLASMLKKWKEHEIYLSTKFASEEMQKAQILSANANFQNINDPGNFDFIVAFFSAIEAYEAAKAEDASWGHATSKVKYVAKIGYSLMRKYKLKAKRSEAANVIIPPAFQAYYPYQLFFSPEQLALLEKHGTDTSIFDPPSSGFWRKPEFSLVNYDPKSYNNLGLKSLQLRHSDEEITQLLNPDAQISVTYVPPNKAERGTTPKIRVEYGQKRQKWKLKFLTDKGGAPAHLNPAQEVQRLFVGSEVNVEPVVNNLAAMVGYSVEPTYYKKVVRLYFPDEAYEQEDSFNRYLEEKVLRFMKESYDPAWNVRSAFEQIRIDEAGKKYIEFRGATLEKRHDDKSDINVSLFVRHGLGKSFKREFRAFALFSALIQDPDIKNDNAKIKLIPHTDDDGKQSFKIAFSASDMGISLGLGFPNLYTRDMVKKVHHNFAGQVETIDLKYKTFFHYPLFKSISLADARWLMRLVAKIPAEKIYETFLYGGYPSVIAQYYTEVFLRRADQLYDALDMKKNLTDTLGNKLIFPRPSMMKDKDSFSIVGYEEFFKNGVIFDPENKLKDPKCEHFARDWGSCLRKGTEGQHKDNFYKMVTKGLIINSANFVQQAILTNFRVNNFNIAGGQSAFFPTQTGFAGGFSGGLDWFIPMRFVIENPTTDAANHPYWVIDFFRLAGTAAVGSEGYWNNGAAISGAPGGVGGEFSLGRDVIRIRPVRDYATALKKSDYARLKKDKYDGAPTKKYYFKNFDRQLLERMKAGDILVNSTFVGAKGNVALYGQAVPIILVAGLHAGVEAYLTRRTYITRSANDQFLVNWADTKRVTAFANGFLRMLITQVPLLGANATLRSTHNNVYQFNWQDEEGQSVLLANLNEKNAHKVPASFALQSKLIKQRGPSFFANLLGIRSWRAEHAQIEVDGENFITGEKAHELAYEHKKHYTGLSHWEFIDKRKSYTRAQINEKGELFAKINFHYYANEAHKQEFIKILEKFNALLPEDMVIFDPRAVKEYIGKFDLKAMVVIGPRALESLLNINGPTNKQVCEAYLRVQKIDKNMNSWCNVALDHRISTSSKRKIHARSFIDSFARLREQYRILMDSPPLKLATHEEKKQAFIVLRELVHVLGKNKHSRRTLDTLLHFVSPEDVLRDVSMTSNLEAFPGLSSKLESSFFSKGSLAPIRRYMLDEVGEAFSIFTDEIDDALRGLGAYEKNTVQGLS